MITVTLNVPENVRNNVNKYFAEGHGLTNYEPLAVGQHRGNGEASYLYIVLGRQIRGENFAVWTCWNESTQSLNHGHYDLSEQAAMRLFLDPYRGNKPTEDRLDEIATKCIDYFVEDDNLEFLRDEVELTEEECEYFEIDY